MTPNPEAVRALLVASNFFAYGYAAGLDAPAAPIDTPQAVSHPAEKMSEPGVAQTTPAPVPT